MLDIKGLRDDPAGFDAALARRGIAAQAEALVALDRGLRASIATGEAAAADRNGLARQIGQLRRQGGDTAALEARSIGLRNDQDAADAAAAAARAELSAQLAALPNMLAEDVPPGRDETDNVQQKRWGEPPAFDFTPRQHFELGEALGLMDFEAAGRLAGSRFTVLHGGLARLERALGQFMIDLATDGHGYQEVSPPALVNDATLYGTGQLPKFAEDCFRTTDGRWLIPTAEVPLTNLVAGQIIPPARLPLRVAALTDCFRSEAGSAGRDTRGMLRQHQFRKLEMVSIVAPEESEAEHERMTRCAETVLERLELPYRRMLLCAGDTGFSAARTYDLEVWLPGQGAWREISSCSTCRDFQARRMNARTRTADGRATRFVHTLNGSGVAVGRALIAVLENGQRADGSIALPAALHGYMGGTTTLVTASS